MPSRRPTVLLVLAAALVVATLALTGQPSMATPSRQALSDRFLPGQTYTGKFPDPAIVVDGGRYYAFATNVGAVNLPAMRSSDMRSWIPRPALKNWRRYSSWRQYNDAFPVGPKWAPNNPATHRQSFWGPSVRHMGNHWVFAYAVEKSYKLHRFCIGVATASSPMGPYTNVSVKHPLQCDSNAARGSIGPFLFKDPDTGRNYLLWKGEGVKRVHPPHLRIRELNSAGTHFAPGSRPHNLLKPDPTTWEQHNVEGAAMIQNSGKLYLFYAGNSWKTGGYATGYAICKTKFGPCRRVQRTPLLHSTGTVAGPGSADPFVDANGKLRLAYAAWDAGRVGNERKLHIATLAVGRNGRLSVSDVG